MSLHYARGTGDKRGRSRASRDTTQESLVGAPDCSRCREEECRHLWGDTYSKWCPGCYDAIQGLLGRKPGSVAASVVKGSAREGGSKVDYGKYYREGPDGETFAVLVGIRGRPRACVHCGTRDDRRRWSPKAWNWVSWCRACGMRGRRPSA